MARKLNRSMEQAKRRTAQMGMAFPDALITGCDSLIPQMKNDEKDRHVLAAAIVGEVHVIVTDNTRHFPEAVLSEHGLLAQTSDDFLVHQCRLDPDAFLRVLEQQAADRGRSLSELLSLFR